MSSIDELFDTLTRLQASKRLPPVVQWQPSHSGVIDITIDTGGLWYHEGKLIERQPLVDLFATILRVENGQYFLVTPAEKMAISVAEVPFIATDLDVRGDGVQTDLLFSTNVGDYIVADSEHAVYMVDGRPFIHIRNGLVARIHRNVFYRLIEVGVEEAGVLAVYSAGYRFELGAVT